MAFFAKWGLLLCVAPCACSGEAFGSGAGATGDSSPDASIASGDGGTGAEGGSQAGGTAGDGGASPGGAAGSSGGGGGSAGAGGQGGRSSGGAGGASGGVAGVAGVGGATAGAGGGATCPAGEPQSGDSCSLEEGRSCTYGRCCSTEAFCKEGTWLIALGACQIQTECPEAIPDTTGDCVCQPGLQCVYDRCAETGSRAVVTCDDEGRWEEADAGCSQTTFECGPSRCVDGQVCVTTVTAGPTLTYRCEDTNPCLTEPVQCACAASLCAGLQCSDSPGATVICGSP